MSTVRKIDYFGGLHGQYLELVINVTIDQNPYDLSKPLFTSTGACHLKNKDSDYRPITTARHWTYFGIEFDPTDLVVQIVPDQQDMLIAVTNSFLRSGDQSVDLDNFEKDTIAKLSKLDKAQNTLNQIIADFGVRKDYPRSGMRNYFYSMFNDHENGLDIYKKFSPTAKNVHQFPFRSFFSLHEFYAELNKIAFFFDLEFTPTAQLSHVHDEFLKLNQGFVSEQLCNQIIDAVLHNKSMPIKLNIVEEAWINYLVTRIFRCQDLPLLIADQYPTNTQEISKHIFEWKQQHS